MSRNAYVDESIRGHDYMLGVTLILASDTKAIRKRLRAMVLRGQRRIHFSSESNHRRRALLTDIAALRTSSIVYLARHHDQPAAREAILTTMVHDLLKEPTARLVLESRAGQDQQDRSVISRATGSSSRTRLSYGHEVGYHEPLLWVPDAVAWAWGRGGRWRQTVSDLGLVTEVKNIEVS
ncbi:MAG: hypothetical protein OXF41_00525 [bacterium]|nr:hypothetical protein [bacterium]